MTYNIIKKNNRIIYISLYQEKNIREIVKKYSTSI